MKKILIATFAALAIAAMPAPKPVITPDGVATAAKLAPATKAAITQQIIALNAKLEQIRDKQGDPDLQAIHEQCLALHNQIAAQLTPEEQHAFLTYLHAQMEASGIDISQFHGHAAHH